MTGVTAMVVISGLVGCTAPGEATAALAAPPAPVERRLQVRPDLPRDLPGSIVFHSDRDGRRRVYALSLATGTLRALTDGGSHHDIDPAWSPDARRLAFATTAFDARSYDIAISDGGGVPQRIAGHDADDGLPAWAADGRSLFFASRRDGTQAIFRTWLETGHVARVSPAPDRALMPAAAPDGERLAYVAASPEGLRAVVHHLTTGVTEWMSPGDAADPQWSPDGARLAYVRRWPGGSAVDVLTRATGEHTALTVDGIPELREPAWSPDGRWIAAAGAASARDDANWDLLLLDPLEGAAARITSGTGNDRAPAWTTR